MNKTRKTDFKKQLVRYPENPLPKVVVRREPSVPRKTSEVKLQEPECKSSKSVRVPDFSKPGLYSTTKLIREIENVGKLIPRKAKSAVELDKNAKLALDEKVSKQVNFPYDQSIYRDLIPLCTNTIPTQPTPIVREPLPQKDIEPQLSDFWKPKTLPQYYYKVDIPKTDLSSTRDINSLRLTKIMATWE